MLFLSFLLGNPCLSDPQCYTKVLGKFVIFFPYVLSSRPFRRGRLNPNVSV